MADFVVYRVMTPCMQQSGSSDVFCLVFERHIVKISAGTPTIQTQVSHAFPQPLLPNTRTASPDKNATFHVLSNPLFPIIAVVRRYKMLVYVRFSFVKQTNIANFVKVCQFRKKLLPALSPSPSPSPTPIL
jgi:hypothetical protein